jgi:predicted RNA-binding Zn-ribbon protein involved in translation (DUF1610 family)
MPSKRLSQTTKLIGRPADGYICEQCGAEFVFAFINTSLAAGKKRDSVPEFCPNCGRKAEQTPIAPDF